MDKARAITCCFTGHRPNTFPWGDNIKDKSCKVLLKRLEKAIDEAIKAGYRHFICGNALGVDTWAAEIILKKKKQRKDITLEIAVPFAGHNDKYEAVKRIQQAADIVNVVSNAKLHTSAYIERNQYMVDKSSLLIAVYDENSPKGGTYRTVQHAIKHDVFVKKISWSDIV